MKSEEEVRQYIRGIRINKKLAIGEGKKRMAREYKHLINLCRWFIGEKGDK